MATFTIEFRDGGEGILEVAIVSDPKLGPDDKPTLAQTIGITTMQFVDALTAHSDREVINADGKPIVKAPFEF